MGIIERLLGSPHTFAVVGVSQDPEKYGYEIFETLTSHGHTVIPVNPKYTTINGQPCYPSLAATPHNPDAVITAIPASASVKIAETCAMLEIPYFWMAPGTDTEEAIDTCKQSHVTAIHGICPVFVLKMPRERWSELP